MPISDAELCSSGDAYVWADRWLEVIAAHPDVPFDRETMMGWFANAIMAGYDHARRAAGTSREQPADPDHHPRPPLPGGLWADV